MKYPVQVGTTAIAEPAHNTDNPSLIGKCNSGYDKKYDIADILR